MSTKYLVTGGAGFIGAGLVRRLLKAGYTVRVLDDMSRGAPRRLADVASDMELIHADIRDRDAVIQAAKGMEGIIHLAYVNGTEFFYSRPELVLDVGIRGMLSVIDACRANDIDDLVIASSSEAYQTPPHVPTDEQVPLVVPDVLNPRYSYGGGKLACELIGINYGRTGFSRVSIFRPHNIYGPDMGWEHVLPQFILRAIDAIGCKPTGSLPFAIQGNGRQTRAFMHIDDCSEALLAIIAKGSHLGIYHVGNPQEVTIEEIARKVVRYFGREAHIEYGPEPMGATQRRCPDITKLRGLGFMPRVSFDEGLASIADWYRANAHLRPSSNQ